MTGVTDFVNPYSTHTNAASVQHAVCQCMAKMKSFFRVSGLCYVYKKIFGESGQFDVCTLPRITVNATLHLTPIAVKSIFTISTIVNARVLGIGVISERILFLTVFSAGIMRDVGCLRLFYAMYSVFLLAKISYGAEVAKDQVDQVIEAELTQKLAEDLLQSIERKFQVDLERAVDMILVKIKLLLQNGTMHIQDRLGELQAQLDTIRRDKENEVEVCLSDLQNDTASLAEKALHQMVVCGYALIGHDPAQAVRNVLVLKNMISEGLKPLHEQKEEVYRLLRVCGHDHDTLKKVIKCVISKSPLIKTAMMDVTSKLLEGIVSLTKLMAHGAMHEACLIEVIKTTEDEAFQLVNKIRYCVYGNSTYIPEVVEKYIADDNATVIDIDDKFSSEEKPKKDKKKRKSKKEKNDITDVIRRMLMNNNDESLNKNLKNKLTKLQGDLGATNTNTISNEIKED